MSRIRNEPDSDSRDDQLHSPKSGKIEKCNFWRIEAERPQILANWNPILAQAIWAQGKADKGHKAWTIGITVVGDLRRPGICP